MVSESAVDGVWEWFLRNHGWNGYQFHHITEQDIAATFPRLLDATSMFVC